VILFSRGLARGFLAKEQRRASSPLNDEHEIELRR